ncbi:CAAX amino terminal protease self- immunity [Pirellulimonas nuda]|uniref:CAAX amino terminal protease self-immunity n=1 Tax=Pirellulimonas nuda TaxID=2528009 RepID=A0A518DF39_9BACT|nr:CPBP family intramembrane glutamic endopeptidase [Pirellulimonas nuda]QDU90076.1 CAAX amino terminal protease self- immunity [Pirellulimonas nuda]
MLAQEAQDLFLTWADLAILPVSLLALSLVWLQYQAGVLAPWAPRRSVPWGALAMTPAVFLVVNVLTPAPANPSPETDIPFVSLAIADSVFKLSIVAVIVAVMIRSGTTWRDLGVPESWAVAYADAKLGVLTTLACLGPIVLIQAAMVWGLQFPYEHPTLEALADVADPGVLAAVTLSAVLTAPLFEELIFRVLFQGAIERLEWVWLVVRRRRLESGKGAEDEIDEEMGAEALEEARGEIDSQPNEATFGGMAFGWPSVLASSAAFALVHLGQGPAPIALFFFAGVLGWLYLRTHRITPGLFAHMALNLTVVAGTAMGAWLGG